MSLAGALIGLTFAVGIMLMVAGMRPAPVAERPATLKPNRPERAGVDQRIVAAGIVSALIITVMTHWWAAGLLVVASSVLVPMMRTERVGQVTDRARLSALASWVESIRDLLAAASGIEEAIVCSADALPPGSLITETIWRLRATTSALGLREGLRRFGEELADPIGDYIAASLLVASERPSGAVHGQLSEAAANARKAVTVREQVEASRARMWTAASTICVISIVMVTFVIGTQATYATWYASTAGQIVLLVCGMVELVGMWWMARMARPALGHRVVLFDPPITIGQPVGGGA